MTLTVNGCCVDTKFPLSLIIITIGYLTLCKNFMYFILILCFWLLFDPSIYLIEEALKPFSKLIYVYQMDATWIREREILKLYWLSNILGHPIFLKLCNYLPAVKQHDMSDAKHYFFIWCHNYNFRLKTHCYSPSLNEPKKLKNSTTIWSRMVQTWVTLSF